MVAVKEFSWEELSAPDFENPARRAWREAVAAISAKAHDKLPECNGRVDAAVKIVLAGDVELLVDGTARVASQSNGETVYHVVNGQCDCKDFARAPHGFCKHRLSAAIAKRAQALTTGKLDAGTVPSQPPPAPPPALPPPLPEAPVSITLKGTRHGQDVLVTLRGTAFASVAAQVDAAAGWLDTPHAAPPAAQTPVCAHHGAMKESTKAPGTYYCPAKMADGTYCKERWPQKGA